MKNLKKRTHERGFVLLAVYMAAIFMCLFSVVLFARQQVAIQATERYQNRLLAFNAAEAGIDSALHELGASEALRTTTASTTSTSSVTPLGQHAFQYVISPVEDKSSMRRIDATGCAPDCDDTSRAYQTSQITVYADLISPTPPAGIFDYGILATTAIDLEGSTFDSYNSAAGAYGGANVSSTGAIAADTTASEKIELDDTTVRGNVLVNENGNPATVIKQEDSTITGTTGNLPAGWAMGAPTPMAELETAPTEIDLSSVTSTRTLAAGTYHCTQISVSGNNGKIVTTGAVKIYVDSGVQITGIGTTVPDNKPGNLHIYVTGTAPCKVQGNGSFYGGLYAPNSDVEFKASNSGKGGVWFGAVVAKTFSTSGGGTPAFHFDLGMVTGSTPDPNLAPRVGITTWQEMNSLAWDTGQVVA
ncbi:MAG: hypothetical protein ABH891_02440 [Candidatus Omnitrophota bacterium]